MKKRLHALLALLLAASWACAHADAWPRCRVLSGVAGAPALVIDGQPHAPLAFIGNNQFGRDHVLIEQLRLAREAGWRLFGFELKLGWHQSANDAAETVAKFCDTHPDGYFFIRVWLGPNRKWCELYPEDCITKADGTRLNMASPSSERWRAAAAERLRLLLTPILEGPYARQFIGVVPQYLQTGEWFYMDPGDFMDYSTANIHAFRAWLKRTYRTDKGLQRAWANPTFRIGTAEFPAPVERQAARWGPFRAPKDHQRAMDMQRFQAELIADTIAFFARLVKDITHDRSLVGAFYGYTMELNGNGPRALAHSGHLALEHLLECDALDLVLSPYSYFERRLGQPAHLHLPIDSLALHGKLAIIEEDAFTHLAEKPAEHLIAPGWRERTYSMAETFAVARRTIGIALTHRAGCWVFDLLSDGRWNTPDFWHSTALFRRIAAELRSDPSFQPEVAFVVDEDSIHWLRADAPPVLRHSLYSWRAELDRTGTPVGYYLQNDLPRLPQSVKVLILANPYLIESHERNAIRDILGRGATVIWTYAPDIIGPNGPDVRRIGAMTGFRIDVTADKTPIAITSALTDEAITIDGSSWRPRFVVAPDEGIDVVARYTATGEISAAACPLGRGVSLYTATPRLTIGLLREVFRRAGVHLYPVSYTHLTLPTKRIV